MNQNIQYPSFEDVALIARALDSPVRIRMLQLLNESSLNISQLCRILKIPQSTCTSNIQILEKAKLIDTKQVAAEKKGVQKICSLKYGKILLPLIPQEVIHAGMDEIETEMPIGLFTDFNVSSPCGLNTEEGAIGLYDNTNSFLYPDRASAGLIWFSYGYLDYRFPKNFSPQSEISQLLFSAEICSEYPGHKAVWPSDITLWINSIEVGTWTSPGDMGGTRGKYTPAWWELDSTQYGFLTIWKVDEEGAWMNHEKISDVNIQTLNINNFNHINIRIGVKENTRHRGGLNLFGKGFGNYPQDLKLTIHVH